MAKSHKTARSTRKSSRKTAKTKAYVPPVTPPSRRQASAASADGASSVLSRALSERIFLLSRLPLAEDEASFLVSGQSGTLYTIRLPLAADVAPKCNCVDHLIRKRACKHLLFVLLRVLKLDDVLPSTITLQSISSHYQDILQRVTSNNNENTNHRGEDDVHAPTEVRRAFELAVPEEYRNINNGKTKTEVKAEIIKVEQKPVEKGDECPICFEDIFEAQAEPIIHCMTGCGNPVHESCMKHYAQAVHDELKCVLCRADWIFPGEEEVKLKQMNEQNQRQNQTISRRGLLSDGRLIDLSELAANSFVTGRNQRARQINQPESDDEYGDDEITAVATADTENMQERNERMEKQRAEREDRARKRAENLNVMNRVENIQNQTNSNGRTRQRNSKVSPAKKSISKKSRKTEKQPGKKASSSSKSPSKSENETVVPSLRRSARTRSNRST